jgi:hypothetical protein
MEIQTVRKNFSFLNTTARIWLFQRPGTLSFCFGRLGCFEFQYCKVIATVLVIQKTTSSNLLLVQLMHD